MGARDSTPLVNRAHIRSLVEVLAVALAHENLTVVIERIEIAVVDNDLHNARMRALVRHLRRHQSGNSRYLRVSGRMFIHRRPWNTRHPAQALPPLGACTGY